MSPSGWVGCDPTLATDDPVGLQGAFYAYGDGIACAPPSGNPCSTGACCVSGASVVDPSGEAWGCGLGLQLSSSGGEDPIRSSYSGPATCFALTLGGSSGGNPVRLKLTQDSGPELAPYVELPPVDGVWSGHLCFDEVACPSSAALEDCSTADAYFDLLIEVVGAEREGAIDLCLTDLAPDTSCADLACENGNCVVSDDGPVCLCGDGYYGSDCTRDCDAAAHHCVDVASCDAATGAPLSCGDCDAGFWGEDCESACIPLPNCTGTLSCAKSDGTLPTCDLCREGFFGPDCAGTCESIPNHCTRVQSCAGDTGAPLTCESCDGGYFGPACEETCPEVANCAVAVACDRTTGEFPTCDSCVDGYFGPDCESDCSAVVSHCADVTNCARDTGAPGACTSCTPGYWGSTCELPCTPLPNCVGTTSCDIATGVATSCSECRAGAYHPPICEIGIVGSRTVSDPAQFADGTLPVDCAGYRYPSAGHTYQGTVGDGLYRTSGAGWLSYCQMSADPVQEWRRFQWITVENMNDRAITTDTVVELTFDGGQMLSSGTADRAFAGVRIAHLAGSTWTEVPRILLPAGSSSGTRARFRLEADLPRYSVDVNNYFLLFNHAALPDAPPPPPEDPDRIGVVDPNTFLDFDGSLQPSTDPPGVGSVGGWVNSVGADTWKGGLAPSVSRTWPGIPAGHIDYVSVAEASDDGPGYYVEGTPIGAAAPADVYRIADGIGGWDLVDSTGEVIEMCVIDGTNLRTTTGEVSPHYDFSLDATDLRDGDSALDPAKTNYVPFAPNAFTGEKPDLTSGSAVATFSSLGLGAWGPNPATGLEVPFVEAMGVTLGNSPFALHTVWAGSTDATFLANEYHYLLLRQAILVSDAGLIRAPSIMLQGFVDDDLTTVLRSSSGEVVAMMEDPTNGANAFSGVLDTSPLEPGVNYLELYASTAVVSPPDEPAYFQPFEAPGYDLGQELSTDPGNAGWIAGSGIWQVDADLAGVPAELGQLIHHTPGLGGFGSPGASVFWGSPELDVFAIEMTVGTTTVDNDLIRIWPRAAAADTYGPSSGYFLFIDGGGHGQGPDRFGVSATERGIGLGRMDFGQVTILASDQGTYSPAVLVNAAPTWQPQHGAVPYTPTWWNVRFEFDDGLLSVYLTDRNPLHPLTADPVSSGTLVFQIFDSTYEAGRVAFEGISQPFWFDNLVAIPAASQEAGLKLLEGPARNQDVPRNGINDTGRDGLQSVDAITCMPRYYVSGGIVHDRFGDGAPSANENRFMTSNLDEELGTDDDENLVDYDPAVGVADVALGSVIGVPLLEGRLVQSGFLQPDGATGAPPGENRIVLSANQYWGLGAESWNEYAMTVTTGIVTPTGAGAAMVYVRHRDPFHWVRVFYDFAGRRLLLEKRGNSGAIVELGRYAGPDFDVEDPAVDGTRIRIEAEGQMYRVYSADSGALLIAARDPDPTPDQSLYGTVGLGSSNVAWFDELRVERLDLLSAIAR